ncbi:MAG: IS21 family transposase [Syntrophus sp. (in: bacteria)]
MKDEQFENVVISLYRQGWSKRRLATEYGVGRGRIRRIIEDHIEGRNREMAAEKPQSRGSKLDEHKETIQQLLTKWEDAPATGQRVYEILQQKGYTGGISIVRDYLNKVRGGGNQEVIRCVETAPGERAAHDWGEYTIDFTRSLERVKVIIFSYILCYCRRQFIEVVADKTQQTLMASLVKAFIYFEGVPREIKSDNQKGCVDRWEAGQPIFNQTYLSFASHYGFRPLTIRPGRPVENLKIERPFYYFETNFLNARRFADKEDFKQQLVQWLTERNDVRKHRTTGRRPIDMYMEELPSLQPLPRNHYDTSTIAYRTVNRESCVQWSGYYYYVPGRHLFESCPVRVTPGRIMVYSPDFIELTNYPLADKMTKGRYVGLPGSNVKKPRLDASEIISRLKAFGGEMEKYIDSLKQHKPHYVHHLQQLLELKGTYHTDDIMIAVKRAQQYGVYEIKSIENFLSHHAQTKQGIKSLFKDPADDE